MNRKNTRYDETPEVTGAEMALGPDDEELDADEREDEEGELEDEGAVATSEMELSDGVEDEEAEATDDADAAGIEAGEPVVSVRLNADLRRRLRRMAQRQGVRPEEVARLLLAQALMNPAGDPVDTLLVRVDKLEKRVAELAAASSRPAPAGDRFGTEEERQPRRGAEGGWGPRRDDFGAPSRSPYQGDRGPRPPRGDVDRTRRSFGDRQGYGGRPGYGDRQGSGYGDRSNRGSGERPGYGRPRDFDNRPQRRDWDERPPRRNWDERPPR